MTDWMEAAACKGQTANYFADEDETLSARQSTRMVKQAKQTCATCGVKQACLDYGMSEPMGIYGGMTADERRDV